jgi:hypothetical protein
MLPSQIHTTAEHQYDVSITDAIRTNGAIDTKGPTPTKGCVSSHDTLHTKGPNDIPTTIEVDECRMKGMRKSLRKLSKRLTTARLSIHRAKSNRSRIAACIAAVQSLTNLLTSQQREIETAEKNCYKIGKSMNKIERMLGSNITGTHYH